MKIFIWVTFNYKATRTRMQSFDTILERFSAIFQFVVKRIALYLSTCIDFAVIVLNSKNDEMCNMAGDMMKWTE